jgi:hypothetical protein
MKYFVYVLILASMAAPAFAQEVQIPFDSAGKIEVITPELEAAYRLFPEIKEFREARLFLRPDSSYFLEISYTEDSKIKRIKQDKTPAQVAVLRQRLTEPTFTDVDHPFVKPGTGLDQSGRTKFITATTLISTFVYGPLIISSIDNVRGEVAAGLELIIGGAGFLIPLLATANTSVTQGEASLATGGEILGLGHGMLLSLLLSNGDPGREFGVLATTVSIGETIAGYKIAHANNFRAGKSDIIITYGLFGMGQGALLPLAISSDGSDISGSLISGLALGFSGLGYIAGNVLSNSTRYTRGDATVASTAGTFAPLCLLGLVVPSLAENSGNEAGQIFAATAMVGNLGGLWLGHYLAEKKDLSEDEGNYISLGTLAGCLIGTGIGMILSSDTDELTDIYQFTIPAVLGTAGGFAISYSVFGKGSGRDEGSGWDVKFNPGALLAGLSERSSATFDGRPSRVSPALAVQYKW